MSYYYYQTVETSRAVYRYFAGPDRETIASIYYDIEEGTHIEIDAFIERVKSSKYLKKDKYYQRIMWYEAAYYGRVEMLKLAVKHWKRSKSDIKTNKKLKMKLKEKWKSIANDTLLKVLRCKTPLLKVVKYLIDELGADPNYIDFQNISPFDNISHENPAILCCRKNILDDASTVSSKFHILKYLLLEKHVDFLKHPNDIVHAEIVEKRLKGWKELVAAGIPKGTGISAYESALNSKFYRACCFLQQNIDEDCFHILHYLRKNNFKHESNWCANNVLAKIAMSNASFITRLEKTMFAIGTGDANYVSEMLFKEEKIVTAISLAIYDAAKRGMVPTNRFTKQFHPNLGQKLRSCTFQEAEQFIRGHCQILLGKYIDYIVVMDGNTNIDIDPDAFDELGGYYKWKELFPIIRDLYLGMWISGKPADAGRGEHEPHEILTSTQIDDSFMKLNGDSLSKTLGPLPPGWKLATDPSSGRTYYVHQTRHETSQTRPKSNVKKLQRSSRYRIDPSFKKPGKEKKEGDDENEVKGTDETEEKKVELKDEKEIQAEKKSKFFKKFQKKTYS